MAFKDHFSSRAEQYALYRPRYPDKLFAYLASLVSSPRLAWDCATGSGQAALGLAAHFRFVTATDASPAQIGHAVRHPRVAYAVADAYSSALREGCAGLVSIAQALHWLDPLPFFAEAKRVLYPGGVVAVWGYGDPVFDDDGIQTIVHSFNRGTLEEFWHPERTILLEGYRSIPFPFHEHKPPAFTLVREWSLSELTGYLRTWSATARYADARGRDPVLELEPVLANAWGSPDTRRRVRWPLYLRVGS